MQKPTRDDLKPVVISHRGRTNYRRPSRPAMAPTWCRSRPTAPSSFIMTIPSCWAAGNSPGAFNMFPTPCRLANCSYAFDGRKIVQRKRGEDVFIHGLIRDEALEFKAEASRITFENRNQARLPPL